MNWRATARRGRLVVNERHPERNADVVVFLDSFAEARASDEGTLEQAVRAAATLASRFLERRDRVGLVAFGGILRWLEPGGGLVQQYRLVDALLETGVEFSYAWKDVNVIPARTLPPRALVVAVTPLLDERSVGGARRPARARARPRRPRGLARAVSSNPAATAPIWPHSGSGVSSGPTCAPASSGSGSPSRRSTTRRTVEEALEGVRAYRRHARLARR